MARPCLVLVAGPAGAGKSTIASALAAGIDRSVVIDKDTLAGAFASRLLVALGGHPDDRESALYRSEVRPLEYASLIDVALENLAPARCVFAVAPFAAQLADAGWRQHLCDRLAAAGASSGVIWVTARPAVLHARIVSRAAPRDAWKLAHWEDHLAGTALEPPAGFRDGLPVHVLDTSGAPDMRAAAMFVRNVRNAGVSMS